ncbi:MAG: hypothetical protein VB031_02165 [Eubacteriaceae bacterium]|nr:hypothetical protein [Eubacteriaceae bacterium]
MAKNEKVDVSANQGATDTHTVQTKPTAVEIKYTAAELRDGAKEFGVPEECVVAALRYNNIVSATKDEAKRIIKEFMGRKVK